jgi:hypothetical protein
MAKGIPTGTGKGDTDIGPRLPKDDCFPIGKSGKGK